MSFEVISNLKAQVANLNLSVGGSCALPQSQSQYLVHWPRSAKNLIYFANYFTISFFIWRAVHWIYFNLGPTVPFSRQSMNNKFSIILRSSFWCCLGFYSSKLISTIIVYGLESREMFQALSLFRHLSKSILGIFCHFPFQRTYWEGGGPWFKTILSKIKENPFVNITKLIN